MRDSFASFGLSLSYRSPSVMESPHRHSEVELNLLEQGAIVYRFGGAHYTFNAGQLALFWGAAPHQLVEVGAGARFYCVTLPLAWCLRLELPPAFTQQMMDGRPLLDPQPDSLFDRAVFRRWAADFETQPPEFQPILLLELEARLRRFAFAWQPADEVSAVPGSKAELMAQFIARHSAEPLTVAQIASVVNLNPTYAMHLFRREYHLSLIDYLTQQRIAQAQRLLATTERKLVDIALECGFLSYSRFFEAFKQVCGRSPAAYRRALHQLGGAGVNDAAGAGLPDDR
jgi:AraC-like DNA-binding protein